jgi:hypothetical protein
MKPATTHTMGERRPRATSRRSIASSACRRPARRWAAFLSIVWALPGVWCIGHLVAHELESEPHGLHAALDAGDHVAEISCNHDHKHHHPKAPPVVSTDGVKKLDTPSLLNAAVEAIPSRATLQWQSHAPAGQTARYAAMVSGPRAPPIS